jgi:flavin-dependent dehydrogenase
VHLPQSRLERLLGEHADELGASIHRGHEVVGVSQDNAAVAAAVRGPDGPYQVTARYLVGATARTARFATQPGSRSLAPPTQRSTGWRKSLCPIR